MKGGLKVSQISLILIGFVCATVLLLAYVKSLFLSSPVLPQNHVLQLSPDLKVKDEEALGEGSGLGQSEESVNLESEKYSTYTNSSPVIKVTEELISHDEEALGEGSGSGKVEESVNSESEKYSTYTNSSPVIKVTKELITREEIRGPNFTKKGDLKDVSDKKTGSMEQQTAVSTPVSSGGEHSENLTTTLKRQGCNFAKGRWVVDDSPPLYSGLDCKQWLSSMWACRLTQRTDFEYEKLRWRPKDCQMDEFTGVKFLKRMQNKTLAFIGDSLGRQQFQSLMCMITGGKDRPNVLDVGHEYGLVQSRGSARPDGWAYRFPDTKTTILYYWSASLCDLTPINPSDPATDYAMHLDRPPAFLSHFLPRLDVVVLNTGHHWNRGKLKANRWVMYVNGFPNTNRKIATIGGAKNFTIHSIVNWVNSQLQKHPRLKAFYRSISPRHFFNGEWNTGGTCDNTTPLSEGKEVLQDESSDPDAAAAVRGTAVKLLDVTALSQLRDEGHISRYSIKATPGVQDCLHWCLPGVPDTWNELLFAQL
ncbi:protein trichome birefringence-like 14 [Nicotiana tabacum]|uniref:Protein trichome birefringence-like 14 n=1 Tax=Nicotiana tabacum TaxID=4097 RepID=A0A1S3ZWM0_TOBAC